MTQKLEQI